MRVAVLDPIKVNRYHVDLKLSGAKHVQDLQRNDFQNKHVDQRSDLSRQTALIVDRLHPPVRSPHLQDPPAIRHPLEKAYDAHSVHGAKYFVVLSAADIRRSFQFLFGGCESGSVSTE